MGSGQLTRGATLVIAFVLFLLVPGVLLPGIAVFAFLVVGWELALSAYSYCIETSRPGATIPPLRECLFFVLVNPTVVFSVRGQKTGSGETGSGEGAPGWRRAAVGVAVTFANVLALRPAAEYLRAGAPVPWLPASVPMVLLLYGVAQYLSMYAAHSGLASIQIGLMRQIGWAVPERYQYPLLATSPVDFWRRWNTYVRVWLEAYVFLPLAWRAARTTRRGSAPALAAAATLAASAALHAAFVFAGKQTLAGVNVAFFLAAGALLVIWHLVGGWLRRVLVRQDWVDFGRLDLVARWSGRCAVAGAIVAAAATWG